jgi:hypothetical protein
VGKVFRTHLEAIDELIQLFLGDGHFRLIPRNWRNFGVFFLCGGARGHTAVLGLTSLLLS